MLSWIGHMIGDRMLQGSGKASKSSCALSILAIVLFVFVGFSFPLIPAFFTVFVGEALGEVMWQINRRTDNVLVHGLGDFVFTLAFGLVFGGLFALAIHLAPELLDSLPR